MRRLRQGISFACPTWTFRKLSWQRNAALADLTAHTAVDGDVAAARHMRCSSGRRVVF
jgi:hypothetical protein